MTEQEAYTEGFCKTAEHFGIRPEALVKSAWESTPINEFLLSLPSSLIPGLGPYANFAGALSGRMTAPSDEQREALKNLIPGVGAHRLVNRLKTQSLNEYARHGVDAPGHLEAEATGAATSILPASILGIITGTGIGALSGIGKSNQVKKNRAAIGAVAGAIAGGVSSPVLGAIVAAIKRRRTEGEQVEHDRGSHAAENLLIPGYATYNLMKRLGRSQGDRDEKKLKDKGKK